MLQLSHRRKEAQDLAQIQTIGDTRPAYLVALGFALILTLILGFAAWGLGSLGPPQERLIINVLVNLTAVLGIGIFTGSTGILSFGHLAFAGIAGYMGGILTMPPGTKAVALPNLPDLLAQAELGFIPALAVTVLVTSVIGALAGLPVAKAGGTAAIIMTLGLLVIGQVVLIGATDFTRGNQVFYGVPQTMTVWLALLVTSLSIFGAMWFKRSSVGLRTRAARDDEEAARAAGVSPERTRLIAWILSMPMTAAAGFMLAHSLGALAPSEFSFVRTFALIAMLIVGGLSSVSGAIAGVILVSGVLELLRLLEVQLVSFGGSFQLVGTTTFGLAAVLLGVMYIRHEGIFGDREITFAWRRAKRDKGQGSR